MIPKASPNRIVDWLRPQLRWITVPSWLFSGFFHCALAAAVLVISQLPSCQADMQGDEGEAFRDVGIHVRSTMTDATPDEAEVSDDSPDVVYENPLTLPEPVVNDAPPVELPLPQLDTAPPIIGVGKIPLPNSIASTDLLQPNPPRPNSTGSGVGTPVAGGTSFLGIEDVGRRFVYVIDRSFSMENDGALQAAKAELQSSLLRLNETQQFQIIFYSNGYDVLRPRDQQFDFFYGTDVQRLQVSNRLRSIRASGGTDHLPAILEALRGNPDVIYLLTDGAAETALKAAELDQIKRRNRGGTRIHCIEFGRSSRPAIEGEANFLRRLAKQSQGQYVYRNVKRAR